MALPTPKEVVAWDDAQLKKVDRALEATSDFSWWEETQSEIDNYLALISSEMEQRGLR